MTLEEAVIYAKTWFEENNIEIPNGAVDWQNRRVKSGNIPPGLTYSVIKKKLNITVGNFVKLLKNKEIKEVSVPITSDNISKILGFEYLADKKSSTSHKKVFVKCNKCNSKEWLDYGTLARMKKRNDKYCRMCRDVGGKKKPKEIYNNFDNFTIISVNSDVTITYNCNICHKNIIRGMSYAKRANYLVCEYCNPHMVGAKFIDDKYGKFDSKIECTIFLELLKYFSIDEIERQVTYDKLYNTETKHIADFYIPKLNIVIEVTTKNNGIPGYKNTMNWKLSLSDNVYFIHSKKEVNELMNKLEVKKL